MSCINSNWNDLSDTAMNIDISIDSMNNKKVIMFWSVLSMNYYTALFDLFHVIMSSFMHKMFKHHIKMILSWSMFWSSFINIVSRNQSSLISTWDKCNKWIKRSKIKIHNHQIILTCPNDVSSYTFSCGISSCNEASCFHTCRTWNEWARHLSEVTLAHK